MGANAIAGGRCKIFLGMAAGVGKTYRMLQEGRAEAEAGRDVVIGLLEAHGRVETLAQAEGLEVVARRYVSYRGVKLEEMDLPAILARRPQLCLIDELAHSNAPGVEHRQRYEDIQDVLALGIDVFTTLNVQHLESLNDQVTELTGIRVRETVPDVVVDAARDVVLVDVTPESLIGRLREGKVYPRQRIDAALSNYFKIENLAALREVALLQVAEEVEAKRLPEAPKRSQSEGHVIGSAGPRVIAERLLALVTPQPASQRVARRAWRSAQRLGADLDLVWVADHEPTEVEQEQLDALRRLASVFGAHFLVEEGSDVARVIQRLARERDTTYILMGTPKPAPAFRRLMRPTLPFRLLNLLPGIDLRLVADRTQRRDQM